MAITVNTSVLTQDNIQNSLQQMAQMFPEHAANINTYQTQLIQNALNNTTPDPASPLGQLTVSPSAAVTLAATNLAATNAPGSITIDGITFTPCEVAGGEAGVQTVLFIVSLAGLNTAYNTNMTRAMLSELGPAPLNGFYSMFQNYQSASGIIATTKALFTIAGSFYKAGGFKVVLDAWEDNVSWYDWVITGASVIAQLLIWFASDGVAFAARIALVGVSGITCTVSIVDAVNTCSSSGGGSEPVPSFTPGGSYTITSSDIAVTLTATCMNTSQQQVQAQASLTGLPINTGFENQNGTLVTEVNSNNNTSFVPAGSYTSSSSNITVTLSAVCLDINGNKCNSSINITNYPITQTFSNMNGVLTADPS